MAEDPTKTRQVEGRTETAHFCDFCLKSDYWPTVFMAGPYWAHESCLVYVVKVGMDHG